MKTTTTTLKKPDSHTRTRTSSSRRLSACTRHPDEPITGICASCLRERLSGIDSSAVNDASCSSFSAEELRRSRSVSASGCEASCVYNEPRRKSCEVRARNCLADLLFVENTLPVGSVKVESNNLGFDNINDEVGEGEVKTMKEHIDLVIQSKDRKKPKDLTSFWEAASILSKKLQIWKPLKHKNKKLDECKVKPKKSLQKEPCRLSVDGARISVDNKSRRLSLDEPRASWDGYLIAKTIPRLAPMISVVENEMLWGGNTFDCCNRLSIDGQMQSIIEDENSSGVDSSSSQRWSSFDRSVSLTSSGKKTVAGLESDEANSMSPAKLVITESELKDWRLKKDISKPTSFDKKSTRWGKMFNVLNKIPKSSEITKGEEADSFAPQRRSFDMLGFNQSMGNEVKEASRNSFDVSVLNTSMKKGGERKLSRLSSSRRSLDMLGLAKEDFVLELNKNTKKIDDTALPFYLTPLRTSRSSKSGRHRSQNSFSLNESILQLN